MIFRLLLIYSLLCFCVFEGFCSICSFQMPFSVIFLTFPSSFIQSIIHSFIHSNTRFSSFRLIFGDCLSMTVGESLTGIFHQMRYKPWLFPSFSFSRSWLWSNIDFRSKPGFFFFLSFLHSAYLFFGRWNLTRKEKVKTAYDFRTWKNVADADFPDRCSKIDLSSFSQIWHDFRFVDLVSGCVCLVHLLLFSLFFPCLQVCFFFG